MDRDFDTPDVLRELAQIINSQTFMHETDLKTLLVTSVFEKLAISRPLTVMGYHPDDPAPFRDVLLPPSVQAERLRQALDRYYGGEGRLSALQIALSPGVDGQPYLKPAGKPTGPPRLLVRRAERPWPPDGTPSPGHQLH